MGNPEEQSNPEDAPGDNGPAPDDTQPPSNEGPAPDDKQPPSDEGPAPDVGDEANTD